MTCEGGRCGRDWPAEVGGGRREAAADREDYPPRNLHLLRVLWENGLPVDRQDSMRVPELLHYFQQLESRAL